jgi:hypothetical protein
MVVERLTNSETDGWANILPRGGTFTWEQWNPEGSESYSHPWGAQAAVDVLETLLGIPSSERSFWKKSVRCSAESPAGPEWSSDAPHQNDSPQGMASA